MPANTTLTFTAEAWTLLTSNDITAFTLQNRTRGQTVLIKGTVGAVAPTDDLGAFELRFNDTIYDVSLAVFFPGLTLPTRLYGRVQTGTATVVISHN
jgi:hypothetical protein